MNSTENSSGMMTLADVAAFTKLSESKIRQMIKAGKLQVIRSNGKTGKILTTELMVQRALGLVGDDHD
jgi:excisionase family DNA binding protein